MREILYKAKRVLNGDWVEGLIFYSSGTGEWKITYSNNWQPSYSNPDEGESTVYVNIDPNTICQFTGIYDINKTKIFENDIINGKRPYGNTWVVTWDEKRCGFYLMGKNDEDFCAYDKGYKLNSGRNEVIGNILDEVKNGDK